MDLFIGNTKEIQTNPARRGEFWTFLLEVLKKYKQIRRAKRAEGNFEPFIENTKEIQTNPAREARRGKFWTFFMETTKEIQTNPAREARRGNFGSILLKIVKKYKQIRCAKRAGGIFEPLYGKH